MLQLGQFSGLPIQIPGMPPWRHLACLHSPSCLPQTRKPEQRIEAFCAGAASQKGRGRSMNDADCSMWKFMHIGSKVSASAAVAWRLECSRKPAASTNNETTFQLHLLKPCMLLWGKQQAVYLSSSCCSHNLKHKALKITRKGWSNSVPCKLHIHLILDLKAGLWWLWPERGLSWLYHMCYSKGAGLSRGAPCPLFPTSPWCVFYCSVSQPFK